MKENVLLRIQTYRKKTVQRKKKHLLIKAKSVSKLYYSPIVVCKCRFIVLKLSEGPLFCKLVTPFTQVFNLYSGHVLQSGITRESLKVSPMLDRTAAADAIFLFWSHGRKRPIAKDLWQTTSLTQYAAVTADGAAAAV